MSPFQKTQSRKKEFPLKIDVLNYTPAAYQAPKAWTDFLGAIGSRMKQVMDRTSPDDLNDAMFDSHIEAFAQEARTSALRQKTEHLHMIRHDQNVLLGELAEVRALRRDLDGALDEIIQQLADCGVHTAGYTNHKKEESE